MGGVALEAMVSQHRTSEDESVLRDVANAGVPASSRDTRRPGGTLYRSTIAEMLIPTAFTLAILTVLLLTQDLLGFSDLVINRGLGLGTVLWIAFYETVPLVTQTLPFALLVGSLMGLGRMSGDRELLALEASGVPAHGLIGPVMIFALAGTVVGLGLSLVASPWSNRNLDRSLEEISKQSPAATMRAGVIQHFGDWKLEAREVSPEGEQLKGVLVWMPNLGETVFASSGELLSDPGGAKIVLHNGTIVFDPRPRPHVLHFERMVTYMEREETIIERSESDQLKGFDLEQLVALEDEGSLQKLASKARAEIHRRFALPCATLIFGLLAVPLFFSRTHVSRAGGGILGILATLCYYGLVQLGSGLIQSGTLSVAAGVWLPNAVGAAAALALILRLVRMSSFGRTADRPMSKEPKAPKPPAPRAELGDAPLAAATQRPLVIRTKQFALARYVASRFLRLLGLFFGALLVAYFLVDLLERLDWFARHEPSAVQFAEYYAWRLPLLASRVLPMALLLASGLTVSLLAAHGEMIGMRACGIPAPRALSPVLILCLLITPLYFLLVDEILPRTNSYYHLIQSEIRGETGAKRFQSVWYRSGNAVFEASEVDSNAGSASDIKLYQLGEDSRPISRVDAASARHIGRGVWRLHEPIGVTLNNGGIQRVAAAPFANLGEDLDVRVDTRHLSVAELRKEIEEVESEGMDATHFRVDYYVKWAAPLSCIVLPALALFFAIGGPPFPSASLTGIMSVVAAVTFILATGVSTSLGYGSGLTPMVAGWGPPGLFGLITLYLGFRLRNLSRR